MKYDTTVKPNADNSYGPFSSRVSDLKRLARRFRAGKLRAGYAAVAAIGKQGLRATILDLEYRQNIFLSACSSGIFPEIIIRCKNDENTGISSFTPIVHCFSPCAMDIVMAPTYRQCFKYSYQYIDHLAVPTKNQCSLFSLAVPSTPKDYC